MSEDKKFYVVVIKYIVDGQFREIRDEAVQSTGHFEAIRQVIEANQIKVPWSLFARLAD